MLASIRARELICGAQMMEKGIRLGEVARTLSVPEHVLARAMMVYRAWRFGQKEIQGRHLYPTEELLWLMLEKEKQYLKLANPTHPATHRGYDRPKAFHDDDGNYLGDDAVYAHILKHIDMSDAGGCWPWTGNFGSRDNPMMWNGSRSVHVRRWLCEYKMGRALPQHMVIKPCPQLRKCCNWHHLLAANSLHPEAAILDT